MATFQPVATHMALLLHLHLRRLRVEPAPGTGLGRMVSAKAAIQIADVLTDEDLSARRTPCAAPPNVGVCGRYYVSR